MMPVPGDAPPEDEIPSDASSDDDFNPNAVPAEDEEDGLSSDDDDNEQPDAAASDATHIKAGAKRKRATSDHVDEALDSGDEATIKERRKRRKQGLEDETEDEGGVGGFVRTRAQRKSELPERRPLASTKGATVDVDALWARLSSLPIGRPSQISQSDLSIATDTTAPPTSTDPADFITISRTTQFAGQVSVEEKRVHKHSAEARLWLAEQAKKRDAAAQKENKAPGADSTGKEANGEDDDDDDDDKAQDTEKVDTTPNIRRPLKRPSRFEPNPAGEVRSLPAHLQLRWPRDKVVLVPAATAGGGEKDGRQQRGPAQAGAGRSRMHPPSAAGAAGAAAPKLTTVEKSRYDWAGFVDKEGIAEELDEYGRSKESYAGREAFLRQVESKRADQGREARLGAAKLEARGRRAGGAG